jgi:hypothetical protein
MTDGYVHPAYPNGARSTVQPSGLGSTVRAVDAPARRKAS